MSDLIPFDPKKHKPIVAPNGMKTTERLISEDSPDGKVWNIPTVWFDSETGKPRLLPAQKAWSVAALYEKTTGRFFPRYENIPAAVAAAKARSNRDGALGGSLISKND